MAIDNVFMPNIPSGQAVYFSRTFIDSVWLIKLTGTRYESEELGLASLKTIIVIAEVLVSTYFSTEV